MKVLMIGAHQDDNEFRCGGLAHKCVKNGHEVRFLSMCNGGGGHHIMSFEETVAKRAKESQSVARLLGITYDVWDYDDCNLVADLKTRKRLIRYIREFSPDLIIAHRPSDYHADHRASGQLVMDASYLLTVPNECPDVPAMRFMPVIMYNEDNIKEVEFCADVVLDMDDEIDTKLQMAHMNDSQLYEWLPYTYGVTAPTDENERLQWLQGTKNFDDYTDEEILNAKLMHDGWGYAVRFAKTAARFREQLKKMYGEERGSKIRYAEAFQLCGYGAALTDELKAELFSL